MRTSEYLTEQEIMRCITDSGSMGGLHLAALERQRRALATAEHNAATRAVTDFGPAQAAAPQTPRGFRIQLAHWLSARIASVHLHPTNSAP